MTLTEALHKKLAEPRNESTKETWAERIAEVWVHEALGGNMVALQMILDRLEGPKAATYQAKASIGTALEDLLIPRHSTAPPNPDDD